MKHSKLLARITSVALATALLTGLSACGNAASPVGASGTADKAASSATASVDASTAPAASTESAAASTSATPAGPKAGGEITVAVTTEPDHLDPFLATGADTRSILFNLFEGLVKPDKDGNLVPAVAAALPDVSADFLVYTFKVRDGILFHNGAPVTAADVVYSLETAKTAKIAGLDNIKALTAVDGATVKIELTKPDNDFLPYLTVAVVPKDYTAQNTKPVGTGPFAFESFTPQQSVVLVRNTAYWQKDLPYLDKLTFKIEADTNAVLLDLQAGTIDFAGVADESVAGQIAANYDIVQSNSNAVQQVNLNESFKPFADVRVRQALSYAIDPDEIIQTVNFGKGTRVGTPIIPLFRTYYDDTLATAYAKNIDKAKQLLADAGYATGLKFTITAPSNYKVHVDTAQVIVNQLAAIGVTAEIKLVDWPTWIEKVYLGREYEATIISVDGANLSPKSYLGRYVSSASGNFFNYNNKAFDDLYARADAETDTAKRVALFKEAQQLISTDAVNVFIQDIASQNALKKGFAGYTPYPLFVTDFSLIHQQ